MIFSLFSTRARLDALFRQQAVMARKIDDIHHVFHKELPMVAQSFQELTAEVKHATTVKQAALVLIKDMGDKLTAMADHPTPEAMRALAAELRSHSDALAGAVAEHGPGSGSGGGHEEEEE